MVSTHRKHKQMVKSHVIGGEKTVINIFSVEGRKLKFDVLLVAVIAVSYTHLDVYKRQTVYNTKRVYTP